MYPVSQTASHTDIPIAPLFSRGHAHAWLTNHHGPPHSSVGRAQNKRQHHHLRSSTRSSRMGQDNAVRCRGRSSSSNSALRAREGAGPAMHAAWHAPATYSGVCMPCSADTVTWGVVSCGRQQPTATAIAVHKCTSQRIFITFIVNLFKRVQILILFCFPSTNLVKFKKYLTLQNTTHTHTRYFQIIEGVRTYVCTIS